MASAPETLTLVEHRDRRGRRWHVWVRRGALALVALVPVLALLNVFGQRPATTSAASGAARLQIYAPAHARSGLVYAARFRVDAIRELKKGMLILAPGWAEQYTVNGIAPQPVSEGSDDGKLLFDLGHVRRGEHYTLFVSLQVNPTNVGHRPQTVWLYDGTQQLLVVHRTITIWP